MFLMLPFVTVGLVPIDVVRRGFRMAGSTTVLVRVLVALVFLVVLSITVTRLWRHLPDVVLQQTALEVLEWLANKVPRRVLLLLVIGLHLVTC